MKVGKCRAREQLSQAFEIWGRVLLPISSRFTHNTHLGSPSLQLTAQNGNSQ